MHDEREIDPMVAPSKVMFDGMDSLKGEPSIKTTQIFFHSGMKLEQASGIVVAPEDISVDKSANLSMRVLAGSYKELVSPAVIDGCVLNGRLKGEDKLSLKEDWT